MEMEEAPEVMVGLFASLAQAEAALHALQDARIPYPNIQIGRHTADERDFPAFGTVTLPESFWTVSVALADQDREQVGAVLGSHQPLAVGQVAPPDKGRSEVDQGAIAWRHYVFESPAATGQTTEGAGTTGNTGVINSGVFATGAMAEGNPPAGAMPEGDHRTTNSDQPPTTDERTKETSTDRSRPETELKQ